MFDRDGIGRDMERIFARGGSGDGEHAPAPREISPRMPRFRADRPPSRGRTRGGAYLVAALLLTIIVIPLLIVAGGIAIPAWKKHASLARTGTPIAVTQPPPAPVRDKAAAYIVRAEGPTQTVDRARIDRPRSRHYAHWRWRSHRSRPDPDTLEQAVREDAAVTKRLNEAAAAGGKPTLGYSPTVVERATPR